VLRTRCFTLSEGDEQLVAGSGSAADAKDASFYYVRVTQTDGQNGVVVADVAAGGEVARKDHQGEARIDLDSPAAVAGGCRSHGGGSSRIGVGAASYPPRQNDESLL